VTTKAFNNLGNNIIPGVSGFYMLYLIPFQVADILGYFGLTGIE
jgi:hypothetical protein